MKLTSLFITIVTILLIGCSAKPLHPMSETITLVFESNKVKNCQTYGAVIGSQGDLISYWITSDKNLVQGAINDMKNQVESLGANTLLLRENIDFSTSATLLGEAYKC